MASFGNKGSFLYSLFCLFFSCPFALSQLSSTQKSTMITLYEKINDSSIQWNITKEPCSWKGVKCNPSNSSVLGISLSGFSLSSSDFLPVVCEIKSLQEFDVSNNRLNKIPDEFMEGCGEIGGLKLLNFSRNRLGGSLPKFVGFVRLKFLDLSYNELSGDIHLELEGLVGLKSLNLSSNLFSGSIPTQLGKSKVLKELALSANIFQGAIPEEIMEYQNLTLIDLSQNKLSGVIPDRIRELSKLEVLVLSQNYLNGEIPESLLTITCLSRFAANQNGFHGAIPRGITKFLKNLDLSYNKLNGSIPSDLLSPSSLQTVDLSFNLLEGSIPANITPNLVRLRLGSNSLDGFPSANFATLKQLTYLELNNNKLNGSIPPEFGSFPKLALLDLAQNRLAGALPPELGNLTDLQVLKLEFNNLSGEIPSQITQLQKLSILNISSNSLSGQIPSSISSLQNLGNLNLRDNKLNGSIPNTIGSMQSLLELQLGNNQLSGYIPRMPPSLQIALNLSHNHFEGPIPKTLDGLRALEVLDLSNNNFLGEIPAFLTQMQSLTWLSLSNNHLSGVIPEFSSWVTLETSGNKDLINATKLKPSSKSEKGNSVAVIVMAVTVSIVVSGVVVILVMFLSRRYSRVNDEQLQPVEDLPLPQILQDNLLTSNGIHRSNIDFTKAMESVTDPSNIVLKTRFSTYYKATMPSGSSYFVKKLNWSDKIFQLGSHDRFGAELEAFGKLSNSNVMNPLAYVLSVDNAYLFYEYSSKGTLFDILHSSSGSDIDWASRYSIAVGVAQGLSFLHGIASGPILLLDLSSKSIFLKSLKEPQVGDIELYKVIDPSKSTGNLSTVAGSVGYIPPEYAYTMRVTMAGNVYSFGVILLELLTGKPAVSGGTELAKWVLSNSVQQDKWDNMLDFSISRTSLAARSQMLAVLKIALGCVSLSPEARPKMKSVLRMLLNAR
ncbi:Leucine-rich repeat receptor-like tyrosine-protein kinase [Morus notabilis]|uniref:Leucine-rich repeat receptor-like tyrosine-protein kinase n=1 Tax=Morus notabilis TaxID=981085 RepID=W9QXS4_9ROSA|nr:leucine-rich repeat receptor protein kinase EMS1 [Morus notabilis]EXB57397.1 Leucine-rich repeat receptor-like tyrosine-protein kinase [Morus notabilis]